MTLHDIGNAIVGNAGVIFLLLFIVYSGFKKWWVFGWYAQELKTHNERLENRVERLTGGTNTVASLAEKVATAAEQKVEA